MCPILTKRRNTVIPDLLTVCSLCFPRVLDRILVSYTSPTVVVMAAVYVILFSKLHVPPMGQKLIRWGSPVAFGVYLIHVQFYEWNYYMKGRVASIADGLAFMISFKVVGCAVAVFVVCLLIEKVCRKVYLNLSGSKNKFWVRLEGKML